MTSKFVFSRYILAWLDTDYSTKNKLQKKKDPASNLYSRPRGCPLHLLQSLSTKENVVVTYCIVLFGLHVLSWDFSELLLFPEATWLCRQHTGCVSEIYTLQIGVCEGFRLGWGVRRPPHTIVYYFSENLKFFMCQNIFIAFLDELWQWEQYSTEKSEFRNSGSGVAFLFWWGNISY